MWWPDPARSAAGPAAAGIRRELEPNRAAGYAICAVALVLGALMALAVFRGSFVIDGNAPVTIPPGTPMPLDVAFTNHSLIPVSVTNVRVRVGGLTAPNADERHPCTVDDFAVVQVPAGVRIVVGGRTSSSLSRLRIPDANWPWVGLRARSANQNGCLGAFLTFDYTASRRPTIL